MSPLPDFAALGYSIDPDNLAILVHWDDEEHPRGSEVLEVGANDSHIANYLQDQGYAVCGVDLRDHTLPHPPPNYPRLKANFLGWDCNHWDQDFDVVISASAIEHFGIAYGADGGPDDPDGDIKALARIHRALRPGGFAYITVPYGSHYFVQGRDWRVYDRDQLQTRLCRGFKVRNKVFFKSAALAECHLYPDTGGEVRWVNEETADRYPGTPPHLTVLVVLQKPEKGPIR